MDIAFTANIMVPAELPINNTDLCIILGNLLDNALEGAARITDPDSERFIHTDIRIKNAFLIIHISNSFNGQIKIKDGHYESVKTDTKYCGIGLSNVNIVLKKYHGDMKISRKEGIFTVTIMLPAGQSILPLEMS